MHQELIAAVVILLTIINGTQLHKPTEWLTEGFRNKNATYSNVGAAYDVVSDTWSPIAITKTPEGRWFPLFVWTGSEMIIWSGGEGSLRYRNGARYKPDSDTWVPVAVTINSPTGYSDHQVVWTGAEMILWGGHSSSYVSYRGVYYPMLEPLPEIIMGGCAGSMEEPGCPLDQ